MTDPKRWLVDPDAPPAAKQLLGSLDVPQAPSAAKRIELAQRLASLAPSAGVTASVLGSTWLKLAVVGGACIGATWLLWRPEPERPTPASIAVDARSAPAVPPLASPAADAAPPAPDGSELRPRPTSLARPVPATPPRRAAPRDVLAEEEALLERARRRATREPAAAWSALRQHRRRFPDGQLVAERMFLSVEVLEQLGRDAEAREQAELLMQRFPTSVYAAQMRARDARR